MDCRSHKDVVSQPDPCVREVPLEQPHPGAGMTEAANLTASWPVCACRAGIRGVARLAR